MNVIDTDLFLESFLSCFFIFHSTVGLEIDSLMRQNAKYFSIQGRKSSLQNMTILIYFPGGWWIPSDCLCLFYILICFARLCASLPPEMIKDNFLLTQNISFGKWLHSNVELMPSAESFSQIFSQWWTCWGPWSPVSLTLSPTGPQARYRFPADEDHLKVIIKVWSSLEVMEYVLLIIIVWRVTNTEQEVRGTPYRAPCWVPNTITGFSSSWSSVAPRSSHWQWRLRRQQPTLW